MHLFKRYPWTVAAIVVALILYIMAISDAVYELTSPSFLSFHVLLRKVYSIGAFTLVGYLLRRSLAERGGAKLIMVAVLGTALYSSAIEVGQFLAGSKEGLRWNVFDTICGAIGGTIASCDLIWARLRKRASKN